MIVVPSPLWGVGSVEPTVNVAVVGFYPLGEMIFFISLLFWEANRSVGGPSTVIEEPNVLTLYFHHHHIPSYILNLKSASRCVPHTAG